MRTECFDPPTEDHHEAGGEVCTAEPNAAGEKSDNWRSDVRLSLHTLFLIAFFRVVLFEPFAIDGSSMEPTVLDGDQVIVGKMFYGLMLPFTDSLCLQWAAPQLGDVIVLDNPRDGKTIIKRVVGLPGDTIEVRLGVLLRNGVPVERRRLGHCDAAEQRDVDFDCEVFEEELAGHRYHTSTSGYDHFFRAPPLVVAPGHVYVRGDHRDRSNDSSNPGLGPISMKRIRGRALFVYAAGGEQHSWLERFTSARSFRALP